MSRIRKIEIKHFRGIRELVWFPTPSINCLIGPGDSGKSTILDAIDYCLGARRNILFTDADFYRLDVETPINISVTLGDLDEGLKNLDTYGMYVRGFDSQSGEIEDEPSKEGETVLTLRLTVASDLEPEWTLVSDRAETQGLARNLNWADRARLAPTRIGAIADYHLGWRRGSVLNRLSDERADASGALIKAIRDARTAFGDKAQEQLGDTLDIVAATANELGIPIGVEIKALLDANSLSFSGGTISLHDKDGIPLSGMGIGSTRLLIAGLQRRAASQSSIILVDELEHGLEPHRIIRFLGSLGAKEKESPLQVFMTTHSPVALRELSGGQLFVTRQAKDKHFVQNIGTDGDIQSTIRLYPEAFLARSVIICEGATEVGLIRGVDHYRTSIGNEALAAQGTVIVDSGGGDADRPYRRAKTFRAFGYRAAIVRDDDKKPTQSEEKSFIADGGKVITWRDGCALEDELFQRLSEKAVPKLVARAVELHGEELINEHIKTVSANQKDLNSIKTEWLLGPSSPETRPILGRAARSKKTGWFKQVTWMEDVARDIVGPDLESSDPEFRDQIEDIFKWAQDEE